VNLVGCITSSTPLGHTGVSVGHIWTPNIQAVVKWGGLWRGAGNWIGVDEKLPRVVICAANDRSSSCGLDSYCTNTLSQCQREHKENCVVNSA